MLSISHGIKWVKAANVVVHPESGDIPDHSAFQLRYGLTNAGLGSVISQGDNS